MAPKKKLKGGKGTKGSSGIVDGVSISEMSREQLESFVSRMQQELEREREERNFFQLERDKIRTFWEITRQELQECRARLRNKDRELENTEEKHQKEMKTYQQKVKHLMYEHQTQISEMKTDELINLRTMEQKCAKQELQLLDDKREVMSKKIEEEEAHLCQIRTHLMESNAQISEIQSEYESSCRALEYKYQTYMEILKDELEFKKEIEICEIEERKNNHIERLNESHYKMYSEIIRFYTDITAKILALVSVLKEKLMKEKNEKYQIMLEIQNYKKQSEELVVPLRIAKEHILQMQRKISIYERDNKRAKISEKQLKELRLREENLQYAYDVVKLSTEKVTNENHSMQRKLIEDFLQLQQKTVYHNMLLEQKILQLKEVVESKEEQIIDFIISGSENNFTINNASMQNILNEKNGKIASLTMELFALMKAQTEVTRGCKTAVEKNMACL